MAKSTLATALSSVARLLNENALLAPVVPVSIILNGAEALPVFTSCAEMPLLAALMAATMPAGVLASLEMAMLLSGWVAVGAAMSAAPLLVDVRVIAPLLLEILQ